MRKALLALLILLLSIGAVFAGGNDEKNEGTASDNLFGPSSQHQSTTKVGNGTVDIYNTNTDRVSVGAIPSRIGTVLSTITEKVCMAVTPFPGALSYFDEAIATGGVKPDEDSEPISGTRVNANLDNISLFEPGYYVLDVGQPAEGNNDGNALFTHQISEQSVETRQTKQRSMWSITLILFAAFLAAECIYSGIQLYLKGEDGILKNILSKIFLSVFLLLLASCLPFILEAFKYGFSKLAFYAMGQKEQFDQGWSIFELPQYFCNTFADIMNGLNPNNVGNANIELGHDDGFIMWGLTNFLYWIVNIVLLIAIAYGALQIVFHIVEVYLLLGMTVLLIPFTVFTPLSFLGSSSVKSLLSNVLDLFVIIMIVISVADISQAVNSLILERMVMNTTYAEIDFSLPYAFFKNKANTYGVRPIDSAGLHRNTGGTSGEDLTAQDYFDTYRNGFHVWDKNIGDLIPDNNQTLSFLNEELKDGYLKFESVGDINSRVHQNIFFLNEYSTEEYPDWIVEGRIYLIPWDSPGANNGETNGLRDWQTIPYYKNGIADVNPAIDYNSDTQDNDPENAYLDQDRYNQNFRSFFTADIPRISMNYYDTNPQEISYSTSEIISFTLLNYLWADYEAKRESKNHEGLSNGNYPFARSMIEAQMKEGKEDYWKTDGSTEEDTVDARLNHFIAKTPFTDIPNEDKVYYITTAISAIQNQYRSVGDMKLNVRMDMAGSVSKQYNEFSTIVYHLFFGILAILIPVYFVKQAPNISNALRNGSSSMDPMIANRGLIMTGQAARWAGSTAIRQAAGGVANTLNVASLAGASALKAAGVSPSAWSVRLMTYGAGRLGNAFGNSGGGGSSGSSAPSSGSSGGGSKTSGSAQSSARASKDPSFDSLKNNQKNNSPKKA